MVIGDAIVYENADIHTLDGAMPRAAALAVRGERIIAAGDLRTCRDAAGVGARRVDLGGATVVPGLADSHIHTAQWVWGRSHLDLRNVDSLPEALDLIRRRHETLPAGVWLFGGRWNHNTWLVPVPPSRHDLDSVCPDRPAALPSVDGHTTWVNSRALALLGIDESTPDPVGGEIVRDQAGTPTGILREKAAAPARDAMTASVSAGLAAQLRQELPHLLARGVTTVHDIDGEEALAAFRMLRESGDLPLRVHKFIPVDALDQAIAEGRATGDGDPWIRTGPVKLFTDGALGSHTCLMSEPFDGEPDNRGIAVTPYPELLELVTKASDAGIAVAAHAIGDQANRWALRAFEEVRRAAGSGRLRHRIEHVQHLQPADVAVLAGLGVVASLQPTHCTSDLRLASRMLANRDLASYAWSSLLAAGAVVAFGSDAPVEEPNPFHGMYAATTRQRPDGEPAQGWQPHERVTLGQALRCYTTAPAFASYEEHLKGRLRRGMLADFVALSADPFAARPAALRDIVATTTVVGGEVRWSR